MFSSRSGDDKIINQYETYKLGVRNFLKYFSTDIIDERL